VRRNIARDIDGTAVLQRKRFCDHSPATVRAGVRAGAPAHGHMPIRYDYRREGTGAVERQRG